MEKKRLQKYVVQNDNGERVVYIPIQNKSCEYNIYKILESAIIDYIILLNLMYYMLTVWAYLPSNI